MPSPQFDPTLPDTLKETQTWFAGIITRPIDQDSRMMPLSPEGIPMVTEATRYIAPSHTMLPHQRIEIYNQQYWWRLLSVLHESFPLVTRLFGYVSFNLMIGMPYLLKYPSNHWSLTPLGSRMPQWVSEEYGEKDKKLIFNSASIDWAFDYAFTSEEKESLESCGYSETAPLYLQPHVHLFKFNYDLFKFRSEFIKEEGDHWISHPFPTLEKERTYRFVLFRTKDRDIFWKEISLAEYTLLSQIKKGSTLEQACDTLERRHPEEVKEAFKHIHEWFKEWAARSWLTHSR